MNYGLYFHIPFCIKKCIYCDFLSFPTFDISACDKEQYFTALMDEWMLRSDMINGDIDSIYIGGGTPSCIDPNKIFELVRTVKSQKNVTEDAEITIEVNPGTVTMEHFEIYKHAGINRISIGMQSTHDRLLRSLGRIHNSSDCKDAILWAQNAGFKNINCDLIFAVPQIKDEPGQTLDELMQDLERVLDWGAMHVSIYSMIVEENTELSRLFKKNKAFEIDDNLEREMYHAINKYFFSRKMLQYEISNYAKKCNKSKHNLKYWEGKPYIGFGLGATSYYPDDIENEKGSYIREKNTEDFKDYIMGCGKSEYEVLNLNTQMREFMMMGFRKIHGPSLKDFEERFGCSYFDMFAKQLKELKKQGLIESTKKSVKLTKKGLDYANEVFREFV